MYDAAYAMNHANGNLILIYSHNINYASLQFFDKDFNDLGFATTYKSTNGGANAKQPIAHTKNMAFTYFATSIYSNYGTGYYSGVIYKTSFNYYDSMMYNCHSLFYYSGSPGKYTGINTLTTSNASIPTNGYYFSSTLVLID